MRVPSKTKDSLSKMLPLRWSLGSKDRKKNDKVPSTVQDPDPAELVQYLESGRRPRCTKDSIVTVMNESQRSSKKLNRTRSGSVRSSGAGSMSCVGKMEDDPPLPQVPEGQMRSSEKTGSLRRKKESQAREENSVNLSSSSSSNTLTRRKDGRRQSSSKPSQDAEMRRSSSAGVHPSHSTPSLADGTLRRPKEDGANKDHHGSKEGSKAKKDDAPKSHDSLFSFLKGNIMKKDKDPKKVYEGESSRGRSEDESRRTSSSKTALSNGTAGGRTSVGGVKSNGSSHQVNELSNGKLGRSDIKRSQSSSNIPTRPEQSMRRTASLHRNGMPKGPSRTLATDSLQRTRYSTNSLGRKKPVPESSF